MKTITICSSAAFYRHCHELRLELEKLGFTVIVPATVDLMVESGIWEVDHYKTWYNNPNDYHIKASKMRIHFDEITKGDAILVVNDEKHGVQNYIGPNVLMEMSLAFYQNKPIYILNGLPEGSPFEEEILGFDPIVLNGDINSLAGNKANQIARPERDIEFLYEMGTIRYIQRTWRQFLNPDFANLAEHHFRVAWIALMLAKQEGVADTEKILKMALMHDIAESRTGDVNYLQRQYVIRDEDQGIKDILADTSLADEFLAVIHEYEERQSIEAKIVKDADNLDVDFELQEQTSRGHDVAQQWVEMRKDVQHSKLFTESAKKMAAGMRQVHPHAWHVNGRNRHSSGDWKDARRPTPETTLQSDSAAEVRWGPEA